MSIKKSPLKYNISMEELRSSEEEYAEEEEVEEYVEEEEVEEWTAEEEEEEDEDDTDEYTSEETNSNDEEETDSDDEEEVNEKDRFVAMVLSAYKKVIVQVAPDKEERDLLRGKIMRGLINMDQRDKQEKQE